MKPFYIQNKYFILPFALLFLLSAITVFYFGNAKIHLFINQFHGTLTDNLYAIITNAGDGLFVVFIIGILLFIRLKYACLLALSHIGSGLSVQILKRTFFGGLPRPALYFQHIHSLYFVRGVEMNYLNSFPSGHSTTAFVLFFCLALISKNNIIKLCCFLLACLTAFSRVYLSQHFLGDITAGSLIGILIVTLVYFLLKRLKNPLWETSIQMVFTKKRTTTVPSSF